MTLSCQKCGTGLAADAAFCAACGTRADQPPGPGSVPPPPPSAAPPPAPPTPAPPTPTVPGPAPARSRGPLLAGVIGAVVLLAAVASVWWLVAGDDAAGLDRSVLVLEPAGDSGGQAFVTGATTTLTPPGTMLLVHHAPRPPAATEAGGVTQITGVEATRAGLYGGVRTAAACDVERLATGLGGDDDAGEAFAEVLGWSPEQLEASLGGHTPVVLRADTLVIDHALDNGTARPYQAVLQAGTAVLIDGQGVPAVRCESGSPLRPPVAPTADPEIQGTRWAGFDLAEVVTVVDGGQRPTGVFVLVDLETEEIFERLSGAPPAGPIDTLLGEEACDAHPALCAELGITLLAAPDPEPDPEPDPGGATSASALEVTVTWAGGDLDLRVREPDGTEISWTMPDSASGGQLEQDAITPCDHPPDDPVSETISWEAGQAPLGRYEAWVRYFSVCEPPVDYLLEVRLDGEVITSREGTADDSFEDSEVLVFELGD